MEAAEEKNGNDYTISWMCIRNADRLNEREFARLMGWSTLREGEGFLAITTDETWRTNSTDEDHSD